MDGLRLALFDFDGTITKRDSFLRFLLWSRPFRFGLVSLMSLWPIVLYKLNRYPNQGLKERYLKALYQGFHAVEFQEICTRFCTAKMAALIRRGFWPRVAELRTGGYELVVVTATPRWIVEPWCQEHGLKILGSELELTPEGLLTGKLQGKNCMGEEKVRRIKENYDLGKFAEIMAFGDSVGDLPMLELATDRHYKPFRE
jgi:HAD superfamily hydrolase (TIGR01490 family)